VRVLEATDPSELDALCARDEFFWLDVAGPSAEALDGLAERFGWHPLVREDLEHFGQRPKLESYDDYMFIVFYGVHRGPDGQPALTEVHLVVSGSYVITVRHAGCHELEQLHDRFRRRPPGSEEFTVYSIMDSLTDSFFPVIEQLDDDLDELEDRLVGAPGDTERSEVLRLRRLVVELRRVVAPQRDLAARTLSDLETLPGLTRGEKDYFRDLYDHLIRIAEQLDSSRDLLTGAMDVYLSSQSNRLNEVSKQLTLIATIFLPLTFVTGFFGQNFGWLTGHIGGLWQFLVFGVGGLAVPIVLLYVWFRRRGYFG